MKFYLIFGSTSRTVQLMRAAAAIILGVPWFWIDWKAGLLASIATWLVAKFIQRRWTPPLAASVVSISETGTAFLIPMWLMLVVLLPIALFLHDK